MSGTNMKFGTTDKVLQVNSPIFVGNGPNTRSLESCMEAIDAGAGAVEVSGPRGIGSNENFVRLDQFQLLPSKQDAFKNRYFGFATTGARKKWHNSEFFIEKKLEKISKLKKYAAGKCLIVVSVGSVDYRGTGKKGQELSWAEMVSVSQEAGADAITLHLNTGQQLAGKMWTDNPDILIDIIKEAKKASKVPIIAKLPIEGCDPLDLAEIALKAGADAIAPTARYIGLHIDIHQETVPEWGGFHGYGGPWSLPITSAWTALLTKWDRNCCIIPGGGVMSWQDVVRLILVGAKMVQVCTWPILKGYGEIKNAIGCIESWMKERHYKSLDSFRAKSIDNLIEQEVVWGRSYDKGPYEGVVVDKDACIGCSACVHVCYFGALSLDTSNSAEIDKTKCVGCGCCYHTCPVDAIRPPDKLTEPKATYTFNNRILE